jgi:hypothetical protein
VAHGLPDPVASSRRLRDGGHPAAHDRRADVADCHACGQAGLQGDWPVTSGVFGLVRHPVYSAWIVFNIPAIALLFRSWPLLLTPLLAYAVFKLSIRTEDEYLESRFGPEFLDYRARVNELIPVPRFRQR